MTRGKKLLAALLSIAILGGITLAATGAATGQDSMPIAPVGALILGKLQNPLFYAG